MKREMKRGSAVMNLKFLSATKNINKSLSLFLLMFLLLLRVRCGAVIGGFNLSVQVSKARREAEKDRWLGVEGLRICKQRILLLSLGGERRSSKESLSSWLLYQTIPNLLLKKKMNLFEEVLRDAEECGHLNSTITTIYLLFLVLIWNESIRLCWSTIGATS